MCTHAHACTHIHAHAHTHTHTHTHTRIYIHTHTHAHTHTHRAPGPEPPMPVLLDSGRRVEGRGGRGVQEGYALQDLERRLQSLEQQVHTLRQAVMQQGGRGNTSNQGFGVWPALTFATWLLVPLVVVFMAHYKKLSH